MLNKIYKKDDLIYRILKVEDDRYLIIDCVKRSFPKWIDKDFINDFEEIEEEELLKELNVVLPNINDLTSEQLKEMHWRYGTISRGLINIGNKYDRGFHLYVASVDYKISEQTLRKRLCDYLVFQNITILAHSTKKVKELTIDEKNFRWALNKYFYNSKKFSLKQAYKYMVREKYLDSTGKIVDNCPTYYQFKYFYYKNRNESNFIISRLGKGEYQRNYRPLLGEGVREFCPSIGYGMVDSTTCDIYLVDDNGKLIGRPIMTAGINDIDDIIAEWRSFVAEEKEKELIRIIQEENLKEEETRKFIADCFAGGEVKTTGTDINKILPPVSRFGGGNRGQKKQSVLQKIILFFEKFFGL